MSGLEPLVVDLLVLLSSLPAPAVLEWILDCDDWDEQAFMAAVNSALARELVKERATRRGWGLELGVAEAGEEAWRMLTTERSMNLARKMSQALLRDHPDHPLDSIGRPGFAARPLLRAGLIEDALPLLEIATRQEGAAGRAASGLVMADLWVETASELGPEAHFRALSARVQLACSACEWSRAEADLDLMDVLGHGRPQSRLESLTARAQMCQQSQDHEGAVQSVEAAFDVALQIEASSEQLFRLSHLLASVDLRAGSLITARDRWLMIAAEARRSQSSAWEMLTRSTAAGADLQLGRFGASGEGISRAAQLADVLSDPVMLLHLRYLKASLAALRGDAEAAVRELKLVAERASAMGALRVLGLAVMVLGEIHRHTGEFDEAGRFLERAERLMRATGQSVSLSYCLAERTLTALGQGDVSAAHAFATESGLITAQSPQVHLGQERIYAAIGRFSEATGNGPAARSARQSAPHVGGGEARKVISLGWPPG